MTTKPEQSTNSRQTQDSWRDFSELSTKQREALIQRVAPDKWLESETGESMWAKQKEIARAVAINPRVAVASCNAAGKSYLAARIATWFLKTYTPSIVLTTAPTDRQVRRILWKEIHACAQRAKQIGNPLGGELMTKEWKFSEEHFGLGFATRDYDATAFQGIHAPHILVVADEAAGLSETIFEGIYSVLKGAHTRLLAIGNPTNLSGQFYRAFSSDRWKSFYISAYDTPNLQGNGTIIPGLVTADDIEDAKEDWGEDSPLFIARVLGRFPESMEDTLIPLSRVEQAGAGTWDQEEIDEVDPEAGVEIGMDVARYGADKNVIVARRGRIALAAEEFGREALGKTGIMAACGRLLQFIDRHEFMRQLTAIKADAVGLGGGLPDRLRELQQEGKIPKNIMIQDMNAGSKAFNSGKYADQTTEQWATLGDLIKQDLAFGPVFKNKHVIGQLTRRKYKILSDGRMKLESKDEMKKRGLKSPDWGDALAMAYGETRRPRPKIRASSLGH